MKTTLIMPILFILCESVDTELTTLDSLVHNCYVKS